MRCSETRLESTRKTTSQLLPLSRGSKLRVCIYRYAPCSKKTFIFYPLCRYDDNYCLHLKYVDGSASRTSDAKLTKSVCKYFDENGTICYDLLKKDVDVLFGSISTKKSQ